MVLSADLFHITDPSFAHDVITTEHFLNALAACPDRVADRSHAAKRRTPIARMNDTL